MMRRVAKVTDHPRALDELSRAATRHLITDDFEHKHRIDALPMRFVNEAKQKNIGLFRHPELRRANHLLLKPNGSEEGSMTVYQAQELQPIVKRAAETLKSLKVSDAATLEAQRKLFESWLPKGW